MHSMRSLLESGRASLLWNCTSWIIVVQCDAWIYVYHRDTINVIHECICIYIYIYTWFNDELCEDIEDLWGLEGHRSCICPSHVCRHLARRSEFIHRSVCSASAMQCNAVLPCASCDLLLHWELQGRPYPGSEEISAIFETMQCSAARWNKCNQRFVGKEIHHNPNAESTKICFTSNRISRLWVCAPVLEQRLSHSWCLCKRTAGLRGTEPGPNRHKTSWVTVDKSDTVSGMFWPPSLGPPLLVGPSSMFAWHLEAWQCVFTQYNKFYISLHDNIKIFKTAKMFVTCTFLKDTWIQKSQTNKRDEMVACLSRNVRFSSGFCLSITT